MKSTKYMRLMQSIKDQLVNGDLKPGDKLFSENEMCQKYGVSRQTVRQAMSLLEQEGLLERKRGSGTYVTGSLSPARTKTMAIGVVTSYLDNHIFPMQTRGIEQVLTANGYAMQLGITYNKLQNEANVLRSMIEKPPDGLIIEPSKSAIPRPNIELYRELKRMGIPMIFINSELNEVDIPLVALDDRRGGYIAARHLIECGHRDIGGVFKLDDRQGYLRYLGFMDAMNEFRLATNEENAIWFSTEDINTIFDGCADNYFARRLDRCTAITCYHDPVAYAMIELCRRIGMRVPEDMSVVGYDNVRIATISKPTISSIVHPHERLGEKAAKNLLTLIDDPTFDANYLFEPYLIQRESVKRMSQSSASEPDSYSEETEQQSDVNTAKNIKEGPVNIS